MTPRHLLAPARLAGSRLLATQSDERLVDLSRAGSEPAFEAIVSRYRGPLLRYCAAVLGRERAEDVVQQTFVKAYDAMHRDERPLLLKPWLYRIAHNTAHNALRDHALRHEELDEQGVTSERPELELERRERLRSVLASVQDLPPRQRDAIVLRELEGRSYEEIAAALGVGGGAVRQLLNRARTTLRTAATAVTPVGLLLRLPTAGSGGGESVAARVAELTGAAGAGAVASKVAATALVTGAVVGGAAMTPLGDSDGTTGRDGREAKVQGGDAASGAAAGVRSPVAPAGPGDSSGGRGDRSGPGSGRDDRRGGDRDRSGPGDDSGPGGGGSSGSNSGPGSGSSGSGSSGPGSSGRARQARAHPARALRAPARRARARPAGAHPARALRAPARQGRGRQARARPARALRAPARQGRGHQARARPARGLDPARPDPARAHRFPAVRRPVAPAPARRGPARARPDPAWQVRAPRARARRNPARPAPAERPGARSAKGTAAPARSRSRRTRGSPWPPRWPRGRSSSRSVGRRRPWSPNRGRPTRVRALPWRPGPR